MKNLSVFAVVAIAFITSASLTHAQYGGDTVTTSGGGSGGSFGTSFNNPALSNGGTQAYNAQTGVVLGQSTFRFAVNFGSGASIVDVKELQKVLIAKGFLTGTPSGAFDAATLAAVKKFQSANGVRATGYVGPATRAILNGTGTSLACAPYMTKYNRLGLTGTEYAKLVSFLNTYEGAKITAQSFDATVATAVKTFQTKYGIIPVSGHQLVKTTAKINELYCTYKAQGR